jgi:hypothetical protein
MKFEGLFGDNSLDCQEMTKRENDAVSYNTETEHKAALYLLAALIVLGLLAAAVAVF